MSITLDLGMVRSDYRIIMFHEERKHYKRAKAVPGSREKWKGRGEEREFEFHHYPLDLTTCKILRQEFPDLKIGPDLEVWARKEAKHRAFVRSLHIRSRMKPLPLKRVPLDCPFMWKAMQNRGYQTVVPAFAREVGSHFNGDQPGLGKTLMELAALVERGTRGKVLVIAPRKAIRATWGPEIRKWFRKSRIKTLVTFADAEEGQKDDRESVIEWFRSRPCGADELQFLLINPEMVRWVFECGGDPDGNNKCRNGNSRACAFTDTHTKYPRHPAIAFAQWDAILVDETHKFLMNANERSGSVSQVGYGLQKLNAPYRVGMSGTPFKGKPRKFWMILHWLRPDLYTAQGKWQEAYFQSVDNRYAFSGRAITEDMRAEREPMFNEDLDQIMVRRTKRELHRMNPKWAPPDKQYQTIKLEMDSKQRKAYESMKADALAQIEGGTLMANGLLAELTRLKQLATAYGKLTTSRSARKREHGQMDFAPALPSCKWDWIKNIFLEERGILDGDGDLKVVIASQYTSVLHMFAEQLTKMKVPYFLIEGPTKNVAEIQRKWQSSDRSVRIVLLSTMAGGVSLTLDAADDLVMVDETFIPDDTEQVEDRVHRTSRTDHQVTIYRLCTVGTIDEAILEGNDDLDEVQKKLLDGRRGQEYAKGLLGV